MDSLKSIRADVKLTDQGVIALAQLPSLELLQLSGNGITDDSMPNVGAMQSLKELQLEHTSVTDAGFAALSGSDTIRRIQSTRNWMTTQCIETLATMPNLKRLGLMAIDPREDGASALALSDLHGKVVLIDFWGSWCGPCVKQLPEIRRLRDKYAQQGLVVLGIHSSQGTGNGEKYIERKKLDWPIAFDDSKQTSEAYRVPSWPSLYLIDKQGNMRIARPIKDDLDAAIELLLAE